MLKSTTKRTIGKSIGEEHLSEHLKFSVVNAVNNLGALEFNQGIAADKLARATKLFKQAIDKSRATGDSHCTAMNNLAVLLECAGDAEDMEEAVDQYSAAVKTRLSPVADYNFGVFLAFGSSPHGNRERGIELIDGVLAQRSELARMTLLLEQAEKAKTPTV
eukprot:IDg14681t1